MDITVQLDEKAKQMLQHYNKLFDEFLFDEYDILGAKPAPWLWTGGTKEVRTRESVILVDTGGSLP